MVFSSLVFVSIFLPVVLFINQWLPIRASNALLLLASLFLYAWGEPVGVFMLVGLSAVNYALALGMDQPKLRRLLVWATVAVNLLFLGVFKYTDFLIGVVNAFFRTDIPATGIRMPIGISFFTFQTMSYTLDVYRGLNRPQRSFWKLLLYIAFFPQLIAGPIVKYHDIETYLVRRERDPVAMARGMRRFIVGLSKKLLIANALAPIADGIYALPICESNGLLTLIGALAYAGQIYFDFSGYSDMAIGMGHMFGFTFLENFRYPYCAHSMREFWRRWHISLSTWFREYLYIPLGGNRKGRFRTALNRIIVFLLTGLWHGASWNFVVWGLGHGVLLLLETYGILPVDRLTRNWRWVAHAYVILCAVGLFIFFRAETLAQAIAMYRSLFADCGMSAAHRILLANLLTPHAYVVFAAAVVGSTPWAQRLGASGHIGVRLSGYLVSIGLLALCLMSLAVTTHNPFIYFRF